MALSHWGLCAPLVMLLCGMASAEMVFTAPPVVLEDDALHPRAFNATYRGTWRNIPHHQESNIATLLDQDEGVAVYVLKILHTTSDGVSDVEGEVVLRDGPYVTADDLLFRLEGVYIAATGRLHAVLHPSQPLYTHVDADDVQEQSQHYRCVSSPLCHHQKNTSLPPSNALRTLAGDWLSLRGSALSRQQMRIAQRFANGGQLPLRKECEFRIDMTIHVASDVGAGPRRLLGGPPSREPPADPLLLANGSLYSPNCHVSLSLNSTSVSLDAYYAKAVNYSLMMTAISFVQVLLLIRQMESTTTPATLSKVSMLTIGQQAIMDAYLCLMHLTVGIMLQNLFNAYATVAFFQFVIFAIFEMRYLLSVWRARRASADPWTAQRELSMLYARFYGVLLGGMLLMFQLVKYINVLLFPMYSYWVPQIVLCVRDDCRQPLRASYVIPMTLARLALPLYVYGCPNNIMKVKAQPMLCAALLVFSALQVAVLLLQRHWGPRWFVPKSMLPPKYDYHRPLAGDVEMGDAGKECVICMNVADVSAPESRMVTPCGHVFHPHCLQRWMDVKLECPTCRRALPPP